MYILLLKTLFDYISSLVTNVLFNFCFYLIMTMLFLTCLLFSSAYRTTVTVNTVNETTMLLHFKPNVLTVFNDNNNNLIMNYHKSLSCNNFPTVPSKPYISIITALSIYYVMYSIVNNQNNLCIFHVWTGSFSDLNRARSASSLCSVPAYGIFLLRSRHMHGSSCRFAPSRSVPASTHSPHFHELPDLVS